MLYIALYVCPQSSKCNSRTMVLCYHLVVKNDAATMINMLKLF